MNRNRDNQFNIRLTAKELDMFERKRKESGLSKTDFFIKLVRGSNIKVYRFDDEVKAIMHELRKIGVNLNQVAYLVNIMQDGEALRELHRMQESFCNAMDRLSAFLDKPLVED
ncbi:MAG: plasmid mobilization relaxosome protein MobC [Eubacterium sp.]|nr:plasmid mobilization relaxosome protein MobC [Eubacterium sp.]